MKQLRLELYIVWYAWGYVSWSLYNLMFSPPEGMTTAQGPLLTRVFAQFPIQFWAQSLIHSIQKSHSWCPSQSIVPYSSCVYADKNPLISYSFPVIEPS